MYGGLYIGTKFGLRLRRVFIDRRRPDGTGMGGLHDVDAALAIGFANVALATYRNSFAVAGLVRPAPFGPVVPIDIIGGKSTGHFSVLRSG